VTFFYPDAEIAKQIKKCELGHLGRRKGFVWLGNFIHRPNALACRKLISDSWPKIHAGLAEIGLQAEKEFLDIYGANFPKEPKELISDENIKNVRAKVRHVKEQGLLQSLKKLESYRAMLAPISYGAGIKG